VHQALPWLRTLPFYSTIRSSLELLSEIASERRGLWALLWSIVVWIGIVLETHVIVLGFDPSISLWASMLLVGATTLGMTIPSSPGYIGVFHGIAVAVLTLFGVPTDTAVAIAILVHLAGFLPVTLLGLYYVWADGLGSLTRLVQASGAVEGSTESRP